jgi:peptidoglycan-associated lipoprotein
MRLVLALALGLIATACAHQAAAENHPVPATAAAPAPAPAPAVAEKAVSACDRDADCGSSQLCVSNRCADIGAAISECNSLRVHFGYDRDDLQPSELPVLQRGARCIQAAQGARFIVRGHADERGTTEYNLALGDRRAHAVDKYLEHLGVASAQLRTVSYGKEKPLCAEHDEACWAQNRRAALAIDDSARAR